MLLKKLKYIFKPSSGFFSTNVENYSISLQLLKKMIYILVLIGFKSKSLFFYLMEHFVN